MELADFLLRPELQFLKIEKAFKKDCQKEALKAKALKKVRLRATLKLTPYRQKFNGCLVLRGFMTWVKMERQLKMERIRLWV